jgi:hypothetical protein
MYADHQAGAERYGKNDRIAPPGDPHTSSG